MIVHDPHDWVRPVLDFHRSGSFRKGLMPTLVMGLLTALIVAIELRWLRLGPDHPLKNITTMHTLLGFALSMLLVFRTNTAYDRWWEGRKLWGALVYETRNLSRAATALIGSREECRALLLDHLAFCHFLRGHLRKIDPTPEAGKMIGDGAKTIAGMVNPPDEMVRRMGRRVGELRVQGSIDAIGYRILDERLAAIAAMQAGCERLMGTPLPFAYMLLLHRTAYVFCLLLPFGLAASAGWWTPLFTAVIAYTFFGLDELSAELEDPFGLEANDLALDGLCRVCEISVFEALGEPAPPMIPPVKYYFS